MTRLTPQRQIIAAKRTLSESRFDPRRFVEQIGQLTKLHSIAVLESDRDAAKNTLFRLVNRAKSEVRRMPVNEVRRFKVCLKEGEFHPEIVPDGLDDFTDGYFAAAEWLLPEGDEDGIDRDEIRGWSSDAKRKMITDCKRFQNDNEADLERYVSLGRTMEQAGHDFYLTREGHGTGFWDRGDDRVFDRLAKAAKGFGEFGFPYLDEEGFIDL